MSRSFRKTPVLGRTKATSEKADKVIAHGRERAHVRTALTGAADLEAVQLSVKAHAHSDVWDFAKDGKRYHGDLRVRRAGHDGSALVPLKTPEWIADVRELHKVLAK